MPTNTRLRIKRGDTAPAFRAQCLGDAGAAELAGADARLLLVGKLTGSRVLPLVVEDGGWVRHEWQDGETALAETCSVEVEVTYAGGQRQTFPGAGYASLEVLDDLG
jgi:hypothetical protein